MPKKTKQKGTAGKRTFSAREARTTRAVEIVKAGLFGREPNSPAFNC